jgi:hypothetical protein
MRISDVAEVFSALKNGPIRVNPHRFSGHFVHVTSKIFFLFWRVFLPFYYGGASIQTFVPLFVIAEMSTGYWLAFNFQVSHISDIADFPMSENSTESVEDEWAVVLYLFLPRPFIMLLILELHDVTFVGTSEIICRLLSWELVDNTMLWCTKLSNRASPPTDGVSISLSRHCSHRHAGKNSSLPPNFITIFI